MAGFRVTEIVTQTGGTPTHTVRITDSSGTYVDDYIRGRMVGTLMVTSEGSVFHCTQTYGAVMRVKQISGAAPTLGSSDLMEFELYAYGHAVFTPTLGDYTVIGESVAASLSTVTDIAAGTVVTRTSHLFEETSEPFTVASVRFGANAIGIINMPAPIQLQAEQQLYIEYERTYSTDLFKTFTRKINEMDGNALNWHIDSITSDGTTITAHSDDPLPIHLAVGEKIDIVGTTSKPFDIVEIVSDTSDITIETSTAHDMLLGDPILISGSSVPLYDGSHTVSSVPDASHLVIAMSGLGNATGGTVKYEVTGSMYDGEYIIASIPDDHTVTITSALNLRDGVGHLTSGGSVTVGTAQGYSTTPISYTALMATYRTVSYVYYRQDTYVGVNEATGRTTKPYDTTDDSTAGEVLMSSSWLSQESKVPSLGNGCTAGNIVTLSAAGAFDFQSLYFGRSTHPDYIGILLNFEYPQKKLLDYKMTFSFISKLTAPHLPQEFNDYHETF